MADLAVELTLAEVEKSAEVKVTAVLTVLHDGPIDVVTALTGAGDPIQGTEDKAKKKGDKIEFDVPLNASEQHGTWTLSATNMADPPVAWDLKGKATIEVEERSVPAPDEKPAASEQGDDSFKPAPVLRDLVWDQRFATSTGRAFFALAVFFCAAFSISAWKRADTAANVNAASVGSLLMLAGILAVLIAAWIFVLELRGRAPTLVAPPTGKRTERAGTPSVLTTVFESGREFGKVLGALRGPLALLLAGLTIILASIAVVGLNINNDDDSTSQIQDEETPTTQVPDSDE